MRHKIFLVHGMGVYDGDGFASAVKKVLVAAYSQYPKLAAIDFDDQFEIEMIHYDPIFQEIVTRWQADAEALSPLASDVDVPQLTSCLGWLKGAAKKNGNFIWSHCADVLLYRLSATVRERVKVRVAKQIIDGVARQYDENGESLWSVVAHSLGTAVAHDALDMLATGKVPGTTVNAFDPTIEQAQVVAMVANVSRLLETVVDVYQSAVEPGKAGQAGRDCLRFLNFRHFLDPFTIPQMFHPQDWPDPATVAQGRYKYVEVAHIHQPDVHDICHYLLNPVAHVPLFRSLLGDRMITVTEEKKAVQDFPQFGLKKETATAIKDRLTTIAPAMGEEWTMLQKLWDDYQAILAPAGGP